MTVSTQCRAVTVTLCALVLSTSALAQADKQVGPSAQLLSLDAAVDSALAYFPSVRSAQADVRSAEAEASQEHGAWIPDFYLRGSVNQYEKQTLVYPIHEFTPEGIPPFNKTIFKGGAYLNYTLFDGNGRLNAVRSADRSADASRAALAGAESEVLAQVAAAYLQILSKRQALDAHDWRLDALRAERQRVGQFQEVGRAAAVEVLRVEAALDAARADRVALASELAQAERDLAALTGIDPMRARAENLVAVVLTDTTLADSESLVERAVRASPRVVEAERRAAAAAARESATKATRLPTLELVGAYQLWADPDGGSNDEWNAAVQLTQPLFTGGELNGRIQQASAHRVMADEAARMVRIDTHRGVLQAADRVRETQARAASLRSAAARYEEVARIEALALEAGTGTQVDYLGAEADLLDARATLAEAKRAEITARVELARILGELSPQWLHNALENDR